jgi:hypothetical protein
MREVGTEGNRLWRVPSFLVRFALCRGIEGEEIYLS